MTASVLATPLLQRRGVAAVLGLQALCVALAVGWFATGHASAPDDGLLQLDVLSLRERVDGLSAQDGRPTMVVLTCPSAPVRSSSIAGEHGFAVSTDADLARRVALPRANRCQDGYVLLDGDGFVRYRSYDPGWPDHGQEQDILLDHLAGHHGVKRLAVWAAYAGLLVAEVSVAMAYQSRGTWWHYLLHQPIGWGLGLSVAAAVMALRPGRYLAPAGAAVAGQLVSITPDLMFRYQRMPHTQAMDWWVGHISVHRGPSPVLVALALVLLGGWAWLAASYGRSRTALVLAVAGPVLLTVACLLATPLPGRLADY